MDSQFRDDLNMLATALLHRGGWGNYDVDQPQQLVWEIATDAAERGQKILWGDVGAHLETVLVAGGRSETTAIKWACRARDQMAAIVKAAEHRRRGLRRLPHLRTIDLHPACDPSSWPRWSEVPVRQSWDSGRIVTYACVLPGDVIDDRPLNRYPEEITDLLHRDDGPAFHSFFDQTGTTPQDTVWYRHGRVHRADGPAIVYRFPDGTVRREAWYRDGLPHRDDGPADVWHPTPEAAPWSTMLRQHWVYDWYISGKQLTFDQYLRHVPAEMREALLADPRRYRESVSFFDPQQEHSHMPSSVFISYGHPDESFAAAVNAGLRQAGIRTWFFRDDAQPGERLHRMMSRGINAHDRVVLICSQASLERRGVLNELEQAFSREAREGGAEILIPIRRDDFVFSNWAQDRPDLARQIQDRVIANFGGANSEGAGFNDQMRRLIAALSPK